MGTRQIIKRLARSYMAEHGDSVRQAMQMACGLIYASEAIMGGHVPVIGAKWASDRMDSIKKIPRWRRDNPKCQS